MLYLAAGSAISRIIPSPAYDLEWQIQDDRPLRTTLLRYIEIQLVLRRRMKGLAAMNYMGIISVSSTCSTHSICFILLKTTSQFRGFYLASTTPNNNPVYPRLKIENTFQVRFVDTHRHVRLAQRCLIEIFPVTRQSSD